MSPQARQILEQLGFKEVPPDKKRPGFTRYLCRDVLPDILIELPEDAVVTDVREAIFCAGGSMQRDRTREAWSKLADTIRNGKHVASPDEILALTESRHCARATIVRLKELLGKVIDTPEDWDWDWRTDARELYDQIEALLENREPKTENAE